MRLFEKDPSKPGKFVLLAGIAVYLVLLIAVFLMALAESADLVIQAIAILLFLPIFLSLVMIIVVFPGIFIIGTVTGTPWVSFSYSFGRAKYYWRGVCGGVLFMAALVAIMMGVASI